MTERRNEGRIKNNAGAISHVIPSTVLIKLYSYQYCMLTDWATGVPDTTTIF